MKKRTVAIAPIIVAFISIAFMNCGDDDGGVGPTPGGEPKTGYAHFMPLNVGNAWVYEYSYSSSGSGSEKNEYELLVVEKVDNYHGLESYVVKCKWLHEIPTVTHITLGYDGDKCYLLRCPWWEYLIEDDMEWTAWSQTGLITSCMLQFNDVRDITVPAGYFKDCKQLALVYREGTDIYRYEECYAKDVGLVYYRYRREFDSRWYMHEYKLKSYKVPPPP